MTCGVSAIGINRRASGRRRVRDQGEAMKRAGVFASLLVVGIFETYGIR
jgi:hypothetical protein